MVGALSYGVHGFGQSEHPLTPIPKPDDPKYLEYLADDKQFLRALQASMGPNGIPRSAPDAYIAIRDAAAANVDNLSPEERAQIIQQARMIPAAGYRSDPTKAAQALVQNIERMSNNQGYTGPDAGVVVGTTPTASGGGKPITRGELLDNENFGNLVNQVFAAAGGVPVMPAGRVAFGNGAPGSIFSGGDHRLGTPVGVDITKMSESERMAFLNKVAELGKDGKITWEEQGQLSNIAAIYSNNGDSEPAAVTVKGVFGKSTTISKDDLMENGTFEKQLSSTPMLGASEYSTEVKALKDAIATADYDAIGYEERVALIQAFNAAISDNKATAQEIAGLTQMLESVQKTAGSAAAPKEGTTLSNGLIVSDDDVKSPNNFMSMVNEVLDRSGVDSSASPKGIWGLPSFSINQSTVPTLRGLDVSELTSEQRIEVLEMISQAGSDREISRDEAGNIWNKVNEMSARGPQASFFA